MYVSGYQGLGRTEVGLHRALGLDILESGDKSFADGWDRTFYDFPAHKP